MDKATKVAVEKYPHGTFDGELGDSLRVACAVGYMQAEKDLALTWEDVKEICVQSVLVEIDLGGHISDERHYTEVLKRFNKQKKK